MKDTRKFIPFIYIYFDLVAFSTVVAFNRFQERGFIHIVAFHRLPLVRRGNNLGGISQYDQALCMQGHQNENLWTASFADDT